MTKFDEREKAFENKFMHDKEIMFKINARTNKKIGMWVASKIGLNSQSSEKYAMSLVDLGVEKHDEKQILKKISDDLSSAQVTFDTEELINKFNEIKQQSYDDIMNEKDGTNSKN